MKKCLFMLAAGLAFAVSAQEYSAGIYKAKLFDKYLKDSGIMTLNFDSKNVFQRNVVYVYRSGENGKNVQMKEQLTPEFKWNENVLSSEKSICGADGKVFAQASKTIKFEPNKISVQISVKNTEPFKIPQTWMGYNDLVFVPTKSVVGMSVEGIQPDGTKKSTLIPAVYDKKKWGFRGSYKKLELMAENSKITIEPDAGCTVNFGHYGGSSIEMSIKPSLRATELECKKDQITKFGYTIHFSKD